MSTSKPLASSQKEPSKSKQDVSPSTTGELSSNQNQSDQPLKSVLVAAAVITLAAIYSILSQLTLSPVYGSVPSATFHCRGMQLAALLGSFGGSHIQKYAKSTAILPVLAFSIPTIQFFMFPLSTRLGPVYGPLITELSTSYPLVFLSASTGSTLIKDSDPGLKKNFDFNLVKCLGSYVLFFTSVEKMAETVLPKYIGSNIIMTSVGLQYVVAILYSVSLPSKWLLLAIPSLLFSVGYNVHVPLSHTTAILNTDLQSDGYVLLHRQESLTGYLSVLQNEKIDFRVMRCDHSLLGGEWLPPADAPTPIVRDPVYAVFTMLEAVRLVKGDNGKPRKADRDSNALVIGLGIGTMPAALAAHGINTTAIEIDPAVHELAMEYFGFPRDLPTLIEDAVGFVERSRNANPTHRYDYIVHDVFTGGVEPVELFTLQFMQGLNDLLNDDGVVAINYAGDLALPSAGLIVRTIKAAFRSCRIFRENERPSDTAEDFTNMIIFCKKTDSRLEFSRPTKEDYLGSLSREAHLLPQFEIDPVVFERNDDENEEVLGKIPPPKLKDWQYQSALGHWRIMRTVIPANVWEKW